MVAKLFYIRAGYDEINDYKCLVLVEGAQPLKHDLINFSVRELDMKNAVRKPLLQMEEIVQYKFQSIKNL